jgi:GNAT superfamily N-acetyltransferase
MQEIEIGSMNENDTHATALMVGELLAEIMREINETAFSFDLEATDKRINEWINAEKYWIFLAKEKHSQHLVGFISMYESHALYAEGAFGTLAELYVRPDYRSQKIGQQLLQTAQQFAQEKNWTRLEVTTPPLPQFDKTLAFYQKHGFAISGGRKLKKVII